MKKLFALSFAGAVSVAALATFAAGATRAATVTETPSFAGESQRAKSAQASLRFVDSDLNGSLEAGILRQTLAPF
ncbi:hypothetical protein [Denitrobaculum tricleocarpae]|uniref:EF-hand domain-containing protein n=1 Tax=Denitrobaculum tricleocarpae TaxID=2591009 RepID=A0A545ST08_9PROT|nr:hypothetical protein [Denitrobaculum tricleocarpae]TQV68089.1 hypothetical protein FKG95_29130 [Denitrobaculum tricleocarpae]